MTQIQIELTMEKGNGNGYFYASLDLPATKMQIENARRGICRMSTFTKIYQSMNQPE